VAGEQGIALVVGRHNARGGCHVHHIAPPAAAHAAGLADHLHLPREDAVSTIRQKLRK